MYRVMIIDDEMSARKLLQASIDWQALNMEVVGEAASGIEAINIIDDLRPDIVFADISMPFMNGIEFTRVATERYKNLIIVILTGLDDFEYARQCVRLPVVEYMLKPFVRQEVTEVLTKIKEKLDKQTNRTQEVGRDITPSDIEQILQYLRDNFTDSSINLTSVAQRFGFNPSYFSRKFKQETGKSFVEFLISCRMELAIKLAKTSKKMFCTANEVGIPDPNYFGRCFKKYTGISYSEFVSSNASK
ncbi:response regulator [Lachnospiraceae bacterium MD1]|uniref:Stage 0 sporulation protein A homolog n=1 Tax=Variimorphobacter saccharofermentans TaxID=2755051 RepID=A0A839K2W2_9FIRM|nr:response regulator [Variimorphobacter saccharofermentans]MBB2183956.1 response regulator [Variimorphobacter saccharofermentans]